MVQVPSRLATPIEEQLQLQHIELKCIFGSRLLSHLMAPTRDMLDLGPAQLRCHVPIRWLCGKELHHPRDGSYVDVEQHDIT